MKLIIDVTGSAEGIYAFFIEQSGDRDRCHGALTLKLKILRSVERIIRNSKMASQMYTQIAGIQLRTLVQNIAILYFQITRSM